jgi:hypothetical protein
MKNKNLTWHKGPDCHFDYAGRFKIFDIPSGEFLLYLRPPSGKRGLKYIATFDDLDLAKKVAGLL